MILPILSKSVSKNSLLSTKNTKNTKKKAKNFVFLRALCGFYPIQTAAVLIFRQPLTVWHMIKATYFWRSCSAWLWSTVVTLLPVSYASITAFAKVAISDVLIRSATFSKALERSPTTYRS
jgi:hypothetical protein